MLMTAIGVLSLIGIVTEGVGECLTCVRSDTPRRKQGIAIQVSMHAKSYWRQFCFRQSFSTHGVVLLRSPKKLLRQRQSSGDICIISCSGASALYNQWPSPAWDQQDFERRRWLCSICCSALHLCPMRFSKRKVVHFDAPVVACGDGRRRCLFRHRQHGQLKT